MLPLLFLIPVMSTGIAADGCMVDPVTSTLVCVESAEHSVRCRKAYGSQYYSSCDVYVNYHYSSDYEGDGTMGADVRCAIEVEYVGDGLLYPKTAQDAKMAAHHMYEMSGGRQEMLFSFPFLTFEQVTSLEVTSLDCRVDEASEE